MSENYLFPEFISSRHHRKDPQFVFNSVILTIIVVSLSFACSFAINAFFKEWFERMTPRNEELQAKFNYMFVILAFSIVVCFLLMYHLDGDKW